MINTQNNERVFFADKVILVEGITDRLVVASLLDGATARFSNNEAIEIVEVGGKNNFNDYRSLLSALSTICFVLADLDYLTLVGSVDARSLFVMDAERQWEALKHKKSADASAMIMALSQAIEKTDTTELKTFLRYFVGRHQRLKDPLSEGEQEILAVELSRLRSENVVVLRHGEIEDYLPSGISTVAEIVDLTSDRNWINRVADESRRLELGQFICQALELSDGDSSQLEHELRHQCVVFPQPISERRLRSAETAN